VSEHDAKAGRAPATPDARLARRRQVRWLWIVVTTLPHAVGPVGRQGARHPAAGEFGVQRIDVADADIAKPVMQTRPGQPTASLSPLPREYGTQGHRESRWRCG
jgi:hypothetical protein